MSNTYYPLRAMQRWLLKTHLEKPNSTMMNISKLIRLDSSTDMEHCKDSVNEVLKANDIFHCRFCVNPKTGDICQRFDAEISKVHVDYLSDEEFTERAKTFKVPYDPIDNPLYRIYLIQTPTAKYAYLDFYHAIMDGTAILMLFSRGVDMVYKGREMKLAPPSYAEYILEEENIPPEQLAEGHAYWRKMLENFDEKKHLPPVDVENVTAWKENEIETPLKNITKEYFKDVNITEDTFFIAATMLTLAKMTGTKESIMSWVHNGRMNAKERRLMGLMIDQYPISYDFSKNLSVKDFLVDLEAKINTGMKYRKSLDVVYNEGLEDECVSFIIQKGGMSKNSIERFNNKNVFIQEIPLDDDSAAENTLDVELNTSDDGTYILVLDYDASRYSEQQMKKFAQFVDDMLLELQDDDKMLRDILP